MKKSLLLLPTIAGLALGGIVTSQAQIAWDGDTSAFWDVGTNWAGNVAPTGSDDAIFDVSTGLPAFGGVNVNASLVRDLTVDIGAWAVRADTAGAAVKTLDFQSITFTNNFTNNAGGGITFTNGNNGDGLRLRITGVNSTMTNNSANAVVFDSGSGSGFGISQTGSGTNLLLNGSGGFTWTAGTVFSGVSRFGTGDAFLGTLAINGGTLVMGVDLRAQGGTIDINASNVIGNSTNVTFNDSVGLTDATIDFSGVAETAAVLNTFNNGGILALDGTTELDFTSFNNSSGVIDITGWSEGNSSIVFSNLAANYTGTIADLAVFSGLTIGGANAFMSDLGGGSYAVSAIPEPGTWALIAISGTAFMVFRRRRLA